jgi:hypothetical protein
VLVKAAETTVEGRYVFRKRRGVWRPPQYLVRQRQRPSTLLRRLHRKGQSITSQEVSILKTLQQHPDAVVFTVHTRVRCGWGTPREITRTMVLPPDYVVRLVKTLPPYPKV